MELLVIANSILFIQLIHQVIEVKEEVVNGVLCYVITFLTPDPDYPSSTSTTNFIKDKVMLVIEE